MLMPLLSAKDPAANTEGTIDPLGLYQIADALAVQLVPGVRERMSHPRFLTLTAVSLAVCQDFPEETLAVDGVSEPWQVFEWHVVEGLVRKIEDDRRLSGLPGRDKVSRAIKDEVPVSARRYLKTPLVFGFHGVYHLLANRLDINADGRLGEGGFKLISTWRSEQDLPGFYESSAGAGSDVLNMWRDAVRDGLKKGAVDRSGGWQGWQAIADHLGPHDAGPRERRVLAEMLLNEGGGHTRAVIEFLKSDEGLRKARTVRERQEEEGLWSEKPFLVGLRKAADPQLGELLDAIAAYESFARLLQDAFNDCLFAMTKQRNRTPVADMAKCKNVVKAATKAPEVFGEVMDALSPAGQSTRFKDLFTSLADKVDAAEWVELLLGHHARVQRNKPPNGKRPWLERFDDGSSIVRQDYVRDSGGLGDDSYVHAYRLNPLWSFAEDLRLV
jgi:hypothetical protein